ncbi:MAG: hypothetical protein JWN52_2879 [Actinomycetia bacterium]|nr:hypothetical protein [Actinomycetes bacterium]
MTDDLEMLLRDHYRRAAEDLHPGPGLIHRAQAAGSVRKPRRYWPLAVATGTAAIVLAVPLMTGLLAGPGSAPQPAGPPVQTSQRAHPIVLRLDRAGVRVGEMIHLTGEATVRLDVYLRIGGHWQNVGQVTPVGGRYSSEVMAERGATAVRVCSSTSKECSATLNLTVLRGTPSATPTRTPRSLPRNPTPISTVSPSPATTPRGPAMPTPVTPRPTPALRSGH